MTFAVTRNNQEHVLDLSLNKLSEQLDPDRFFRANRQIILCIDAIDHAEPYFNGKISVTVRPPYKSKITISEEKLAAFKAGLIFNSKERRIFAPDFTKLLSISMKKGLLYAILASVLWAIVNPFIKQGLSYDFTPMNFAGLRFTSVGVLLFAYTWHKGMWQEIKQHRKLFLNLIFINMFMGYTAFYFGVDFVSGAISSIIMGMTPLIMYCLPICWQVTTN